MSLFTKAQLFKRLLYKYESACFANQMYSQRTHPAACDLKIKIEVPGAKGVINRITKKTLRKRSLLLFAQKEPYERISR